MSAKRRCRSGGEHGHQQGSRRRDRGEQAPSPSFLEALEAQRRSSAATTSAGQEEEQQQQQQQQPSGAGRGGGAVPAHIPGFYFDAERQRYFPLRRGQPPVRAASPERRREDRGDGGSVGKAQAVTQGGVKGGLASMLVRRQVVGNAGAGKASVVNHLVSTQLEVSSTRFREGDPSELQEMDVRRRRIAVGCKDQSVIILETDPEGELVRAVCNHHVATPVSCVRWRPSGDFAPRTLAVSEFGHGLSAGAVTILHDTGEEGALRLDRFVVQRDCVRTLAWEKEAAQKVVVGVSRGQRLVVLDTLAGRKQCYGPPVSSDIKSCGFMNAGREVVYGSRNGEIRLVDLRDRGGGDGGSPTVAGASSWGTVVLSMDLPIDHQHVLRDGYSLVVSDEGGALRRCDMRMPGRTALRMEGHCIAPLSSPHFSVSPSEAFCLAVGRDAILRAFSLTRGGPPLRSWPALPPVAEGGSQLQRQQQQVLSGRGGLFLSPDSWGCNGADGGKGMMLAEEDWLGGGELWMASRVMGQVYRLDLHGGGRP